MLRYDDSEMPIPGLVCGVYEIMMKIPKQTETKKGQLKGNARSLEF